MSEESTSPESRVQSCKKAVSIQPSALSFSNRTAFIMSAHIRFAIEISLSCGELELAGP